jgi:hypothetical protein
MSKRSEGEVVFLIFQELVGVSGPQNRTAVLLLDDWWKRSCVATARDSYIQFISRGMYSTKMGVENNYSALGP